MSSLPRRASSAPRAPFLRRVLGLAIALGVLVPSGIVLGGTGSSAAASARPGFVAQDQEGTPNPAPVILVGVGGLDWDDVDPRTTPTLWRMVGGGAVGSISARTTSPESCPVEAWATVGAGRRVQIPEDPAVVPEGCSELPEVVTAPDADTDVRGALAPATVTGWAELLAALTPGTAAPGELGTRIAEAGACAVAVGPGAALALADRDGVVAQYATEPSRRALAACPVTVVDAGDLAVEPAQRQDDLADLDELLDDVLERRPDGARVVVAGLYGTATQARGLQAVVDYPAAVGWLTSESTRYPGVVTASDLTATALAAVHGVAADLDGAQLTVQSERRMSTQRTVDNRRYLTAMSTTISLLRPVMLAVFALAVAGCAIPLLRSRRRSAPDAGTPAPETGGPGPATRRVVTAVLTLAGAVPAGAYLAALSRWWVVTAAGVAAAVTTVVAITVVALLAWVASRWLRPGPWRLGSTLAGASWLVLTLDALTGTTLQQGSLLGQVPTLGSRFYGFGNVAFSVYAVSGLVLAGSLAAAAVGSGRQDGGRRASVAVVGVGAVTVLVAGWPSLGADFGGLLALVPAFAVLLAHVVGRRLSWRRVLAVAAVTVLVVTVVAVLDWVRPGPGTHLGRFVQRVVDGEGPAVVIGKAEQALATMINPGGAVLVVAVLAGILVVVGPWRPAAVRALFAARPLLAGVCRAVVVAAVLGTLLNDSGIFVGAGVLGLAVAVLGASAAEARWYGRPSSRSMAPRLPRALIAVGAGALAMMLLGAAVVSTAEAGSVPRGGDAAVGPGPVVLVGTTGVTWRDVGPASTPMLWGLVRDGAAIGGVTPAVTSGSRRCTAAGWLALSAGRPTIAGQPGDEHWQCAPWQVDPGAGGTAEVSGWPALLALQARSEFNPRPGALGAALADAGACAVAVGPGAGIALAGRDGSIPRYRDLKSALADREGTFACPVTVVDVLEKPAAVGTAASLRSQDLAVRRVLAAAPENATVVIVDVGGASSARPALGIGLVSGGADRAGGHLTTSSTRWTGVVRLLDVPTTLLAAAEAPQPGEFSGAPLLETGTRSAVPTTAIDGLADLTTRDQALRGTAGTVVTWALLLGLAALAAVVLARPGRIGTAVRRAGQVAGVVLAALPTGLFLMTTWQWWTFGSPGAAMWLALGLATASVAGVIALVARRPGWLGPAVACGLAGALLTLDALLGTPLHRGSPLGPAVTLGGRFYGFGNPTYSVYVVAMVGVAVAVATVLLRRGRRRAAVAASGGIGALALLVDLWPTLGADVGGGLVLVPVFAIVVLAVAGVRVTLLRLVLTGVAGLLVVGLIAVLDWQQPAGARSHLGRFVQSLVDGTAWETVARKGGYALGSLTSGPMVWLTVALLIGLVLVLWRRGRLRARWLERVERELPLVRPGLWALVVSALAGAAVNDYGMRVATYSAAVLVPLLVLAAARTEPDAPGSEPAPIGADPGPR